LCDPAYKRAVHVELRYPVLPPEHRHGNRALPLPADPRLARVARRAPVSVVARLPIGDGLRPAASPRNAAVRRARITVLAVARPPGTLSAPAGVLLRTEVPVVTAAPIRFLGAITAAPHTHWLERPRSRTLLGGLAHRCSHAPVDLAQVGARAGIVIVTRRTAHDGRVPPAPHRLP